MKHKASTCSTCTPWVARTTNQLLKRFSKMSSRSGQYVQPYACPDCGSRDWATTEEFIDAARDARRFRCLTLLARCCLIGAGGFFVLTVFAGAIETKALAFITSVILATLAWTYIRSRDWNVLP